MVSALFEGVLLNCMNCNRKLFEHSIAEAVNCFVIIHESDN